MDGQLITVDSASSASARKSLTKRLLRMSIKNKDGCRLWTASIGGGGYGRITVGGRKGPRAYAHRVSYETFVGPIPDRMHVLHRCDVRRCINPGHLFIGTNADNVADREAKNRGVIPGLVGSECPWATLTNADVLAIRKRANSREPQISIAHSFGIAQSLVSMIKTRQRWGHIQ